MADKVDIFMPLYVADYDRDTSDLSFEEHGFYGALLRALWVRGGSLVLDRERLARMLRTDPKTFDRLWAATSHFFTQGEDGTLSQKRLSVELEKALGLRRAASEGGKRSAAARALKNGTAQPAGRHPARTAFERSFEPPSEPPSERPSEPRPEPIPNTSPSPSQKEIVSVSPAHARDPLWPAGVWLSLFKRAWADRYKTLTYGQTSDGRACGTLADFLAAMDPDARGAAQARGDKMLAEFLGDESPEVVKARHPFAFFVGRFGGLLVDQVRTKADADPRCNHHRQQGTFRTLPRGGPVTGCPTCRENAAARGNREASPTAASDALPKFKPPAAWTPEQLAEAEQLRKTAAGGSK